MYLLESTKSELKKTASMCVVLISLIQHIEGKYFSAVGRMNGRPVVTLRSNPLRVRRSFPDLPQLSIPVPLNNTTLPWIFYP